ncbi:MAG TPA: adenosylmethionine--8-amino-7-oxononanoate transaminase [Candidatus Omnitrophica bacterium]|nr:adenosylmethionine--8-amino-7-oxononanoate transaminase [Candidatus Omnitrophota bacterium]
MTDWVGKDLKYVWHPYTQMKDCRNMPPLLIERAKGIKLYDTRGRFYYDTISSWWCNVHGHNNPAIKSAIKKQLDLLEHVLFAGFTHKPAIELAQKLAALAPAGLSRVFYSDNGSTSVEVALKMSFQYWHNTGERKKTKFVSLDRGYHGDTFGAMSVSGVSLFNEVFSPLFFESFKVPSPYCYRCPVGMQEGECDTDCLKPLERLLEKRSKEIAGIILEPRLMAAGGMIIYPEKYLKGAASLAKRFNVHLILDEVATAFGRTGRMFASGSAGVLADFICLSKGITSGYLPMGVTLTTDKIYKAFYADFEQKKTFYHGHTYTANPVACAAALASLEIFEKDNTLKKAAGLIPLFRERLEGFKALPFVGDVRSIGLVGALELVKDKKTKEALDFRERTGLKVYKAGLEKNLILRPLGDIIYFFLPLCVKRAELEDILDRSYSVVKKAFNG